MKSIDFKKFQIDFVIQARFMKEMWSKDLLTKIIEFFQIGIVCKINIEALITRTIRQDSTTICLHKFNILIFFPSFCRYFVVAQSLIICHPIIGKSNF